MVPLEIQEWANIFACASEQSKFPGVKSDKSGIRQSVGLSWESLGVYYWEGAESEMVKEVDVR